MLEAKRKGAKGQPQLDHADRSKEKRFDFVVSVLQEPSGIEVGDDRDRRLKGLGEEKGDVSRGRGPVESASDALDVCVYHRNRVAAELLRQVPFLLPVEPAHPHKRARLSPHPLPRLRQLPAFIAPVSVGKKEPGRTGGVEEGGGSLVGEGLCVGGQPVVVRVLVVEPAPLLLGVRQDLVRVRDVLEALSILLGLLRVLIRVQLQRELAVDTLDLRVGGRGGYAKGLERVLAVAVVVGKIDALRQNAEVDDEEDTCSNSQQPRVTREEGDQLRARRCPGSLLVCILLSLLLLQLTFSFTFVPTLSQFPCMQFLLPLPFPLSLLLFLLLSLLLRLLLLLLLLGFSWLRVCFCASLVLSLLWLPLNRRLQNAHKGGILLLLLLLSPCSLRHPQCQAATKPSACST
mmetsp:Transcript_8523/g.19269  ORF Transcript_8523/g.19269 Transcript_8523/m.19269 type:complete len:403 (-) Transcript_8523:7-1215(-)